VPGGELKRESTSRTRNAYCLEFIRDFQASHYLVGMSTPAFYESQAARCREYAAKSRDADTIKRWLQLALEYEQLAASMASVPQVADGAPQAQRLSKQQQEIQQRQGKSESDKD
jgi:hypothetical protein